MMKKIWFLIKNNLDNLFLILISLVLFYGAYRQILKNDWKNTLIFLGIGMVLFLLALPSLMYQKSFWEFFTEHRWTRYVYALGSLLFSLVCFGVFFTDFSWKWNNLFWGFGGIFFGLGVLVIIYYDYSSLKK